MRPLPARRYELADWKHAKVNIDYCVCYDDRLYSVPYTLVGARVEIRATASVVELFHDSVRVASHARSYGRKGSAVIVDEHRPRAHRDYGKWPPERVVAWAETIGPNVGELARAVMRHRTHPETGYRTCLGVIRLADKYGRERVDAACARALRIGSPTAKSVTAILRNGLDRAPLVEPPPRGALQQLAVARADGTYANALAGLAKVAVLVLDDFLLAPMTDVERRDLLEVLEDRYDRSSTVTTSQIPTKSWHQAIGEASIADAICNRVVHNARLVTLRGGSMRQKKAVAPEVTETKT
ncbi:ATP-binding protein [Sorangium cellulosum]|uniref:IstB-like ATP-binding protein domain-containing protein n=1 Tax=Sorangium cellulosum So0157-2 TaxID=1254432 RepID=S4XUE6_SORCE|nr:ATP-binding protein [Sorangium cellulosum]AGP35495.1 hypothetical protein SCE1572_13725 [Sorangium cellulosum So0157-2]